MHNSKDLLGLLSVVIGLIAYVPYYRNIFAGKTKPHAFSWLVWSVLTGIAFAIQLVSGGGAGSWALGITSVACASIFVLALIKGERSFPFFDWAALTVASISLVLWLMTKNPIPSAILLCLTDTISYLPSFRKGFRKPFEETVTTFAIDEIKIGLALLALTTYTIETSLYLTGIFIMNGVYVLMLLIRRRQLRE